MTTVLLGLNTILLAMILAVLIRHIERQEWISLLDAVLRLCWSVLLVLVPISQAIATITWEVRRYQRLPVFLETLPFSLLFLSFAPFAILCRKEYKRWQAVSIAAIWTVSAAGLMLLSLWDPMPRSDLYTKINEFVRGWLFGFFRDILAWGMVLGFMFFVRRTMKEECRTLAKVVTSNQAMGTES